MSFFKTRRKVVLEDFCEEFYKNNILNPVVSGVNFNKSLAETYLKSLSEVDKNFLDIDIQKFVEEMIILRFEIFALAWQHRFDDKSSVYLSIFTDDFLNNIDRHYIWEKLEEYNQAIARSETISKPKEPLSEHDSIKMLFFNHWTKDGLKADCVARTINRWFTEDPWKNDITPNFLMFIFLNYLGFEETFDATKDAKFRLVAIIHGFYNGIMDSLKEIKLKGDYKYNSNK